MVKEVVFNGFPRDVKSVPVPSPMFGVLLEVIDDFDELKLILRVIFLLHRKRGHPRDMTLGELLSDRILANALASLGRPDHERVKKALDKAIRHGIIDARVNDDIEKTRFSLHIQNRQTRYSGSNFGEHTSEDDEEKNPWLAEVARPNIFAQYEDNIGMLTPMVADELREAESHYPMSWIDEAFKEAVTQNKRSWRYVSRILERWDREGRHHGKSGRYPKKTGRY